MELEEAAEVSVSFTNLLCIQLVYKRIYTLCQLCPTMYSTHIFRLVVVRQPEKEINLAAIPSN
jgi:hypothetical protein